MKCKRNSDGRALDHATLQTMRIQAVKAVNEGASVASVAAAYGVNVRSVFRWLAAYADGGQRALEAKPIPGRPPKLSDRQLAQVAGMVLDGTPQQYGLEFSLWTTGLVREAIARELGIAVSRATVGRALHGLGLTPQRPLYRAAQRDPAQVERWRREEFPAIAAEAKRVGASILFGDEAAMRSDYHAGTTWGALGRTPTATSTGKRFSLNMLSAVAADGQFRFMLHEGRVDAGVFLEFLKRLMQDSPLPVFLVVDGHPIHRAKIVDAFVQAQEGRLKLFVLPPYSPHLNPDEQAWGNVKARVAKRTVLDKEDLRTKLVAALERLRELPEIVAGFFRHPDCEYILLE